MLKSCSVCGGLHPANYHHRRHRDYTQTEERKLRATNVWTQKSLEVRDKAHYLCEVCRDQGQLTYTDLEVHHIEKLADKPEALLDNDNLVCLCVMHHKMADRGEIDKEYLKELARRREK